MSRVGFGPTTPVFERANIVGALVSENICKFTDYFRSRNASSLKGGGCKSNRTYSKLTYILSRYTTVDFFEERGQLMAVLKIFIKMRQNDDV
jgi:hypothetical protein